MSDEQQQYDTEITLGIGKLLGLFFMLVILCGIFMGLGYMLGRNSSKQEGMLAADAVPAGTISNTAKPGATQSTPAKPATSDAPQQQPAAPERTETTETSAPKTEAAAPVATSGQAPEMSKLPGGGYVVQIAAVSKKEDAEALQSALQHKQYPVLISSGAADKLFHVQIGPYADLKDAESMKSRLASDGYNAIVKR